MTFYIQLGLIYIHSELSLLDLALSDNKQRAEEFP